MYTLYTQTSVIDRQNCTCSPAPLHSKSLPRAYRSALAPWQCTVLWCCHWLCKPDRNSSGAKPFSCCCLGAVQESRPMSLPSETRRIRADFKAFLLHQRQTTESFTCGDLSSLSDLVSLLLSFGPGGSWTAIPIHLGLASI